MCYVLRQLCTHAAENRCFRGGLAGVVAWLLRRNTEQSCCTFYQSSNESKWKNIEESTRKTGTVWTAAKNTDATKTHNTHVSYVKVCVKVFLSTHLAVTTEEILSGVSHYVFLRGECLCVNVPTRMGAGVSFVLHLYCSGYYGIVDGVFFFFHQRRVQFSVRIWA